MENEYEGKKKENMEKIRKTYGKSIKNEEKIRNKIGNNRRPYGRNKDKMWK